MATEDHFIPLTDIFSLELIFLAFMLYFIYNYNIYYLQNQYYNPPPPPQLCHIMITNLKIVLKREDFVSAFCYNLKHSIFWDVDIQSVQKKKNHTQTEILCCYW